MATAILAGGPGAVFWMWLMAIVGAASAFVESTLAQIWKVRGKEGEFRGGPAYYIEKALGKRWLGILFAVLLILCFAFGFNGLQAFNATSALEYYIPDYATNGTAIACGIVLAVMTAFVIFGGAKRISVITSIIVPIMAIGYIAIAVWTTLSNITELPGVFAMVFASAFDVQAIFGGFAVLVFYVQDPQAASALNGMPLVQMAVNNSVGEFGIHFITFAIFAFAFSSLIGNYFYAENNLRFIKGDSKALLFVFRVVCLCVVFYGAVNSFDLAWNLADIFMGFMALVNLIALLFLGKWALAALDDYTRQRKEGIDPVFVADRIPGMPKTECWHVSEVHDYGKPPVKEYLDDALDPEYVGLN